MPCRHYQGMFVGWVSVEPWFPVMVFPAGSLSDAIRQAQKEIKSREVEFLEYYADETPPPDPLPVDDEGELSNLPNPFPKHQGGE